MTLVELECLEGTAGTGGLVVVEEGGEEEVVEVVGGVG